MSNNSKDTIQINLHPSQAMLQIINPNTAYCLFPRSGGKTGGVIAPRLQHLDLKMPRCQILLVSDTYERLKNIIVPSIVFFWESVMGMKEDIDFVRFKRPPNSWTRSLVPLNNFENVISLPSGTRICLVSLAVDGCANGFNAQAAIVDEAKFCDETKINTQVLPALRGCKDLFEHCPEYRSIWMCTDKFGKNIKWLLNKKKLVNQKAVDIVYTLQMEIFRLKQKQANCSSTERFYHYKPTIDKYQSQIDNIRKHLIYYCDMAPYENLPTVGENFFKTQKRLCKSIYEYEVAILNRDPDQVENCFYPTFTDANKYEAFKNEDYNTNAPLYIALDYNFRITPIPIAQETTIGNSIYKTLNFIDEVFVLHPKGLIDAIEELCTRYSSHNNKTINFIYDHTAIGRNPLKTTYKDEVIKAIQSYGWIVIEHFIGDAPDHDIKFQKIRDVLSSQGDNAVMINKLKCEYLIKSIEQSPAKITNGVTKKDKRTETDLNYPAEESTHFSDAFDMILWGMYEHCIIGKSNNVYVPIGFVN